jgi:hypothetical protein
VSEQQPEMYDEINVLLGSLGKAFSMEGADVAKAIEKGEMHMRLGSDADGDRFVEANYNGKVALVYPGSAKGHMAPDRVEELDQD